MATAFGSGSFRTVLRQRIVLAALSVALSPLSSSAQATQPVLADPSTPKGALKALALAMDQGDSEAIHRLMDTSTPAQGKMVDMISEMAGAIADLNRAMSTRFGPVQAQAVMGNSGEQLRQSIADIDTASEVDTGDAATVSIAPTERGTMSLRRVNGFWKISMQNRVDKLTPQQVDEDVAMLSGQIHGMRDVSAEVRAGKYPTAADAAAALHARMGASAGGTPASQPVQR
jgi:hypothetical protein